ncbi:MAG: hypothetical protein ACRDRZ_14600 [Pseudonocardiaceae bacterium]
MPYLTSLLMAGAATLVLLLVLLVRLVVPARRAGRAARRARTTITEHIRLLSSRIAALRVELDRRLHRRVSEGPEGHTPA